MYLGNGDGTFQPAIRIDSGTNIRFVALGDLNNDGILDVVTGNGGPTGIGVLLGNGDGTFQQMTTFGSTGCYYGAIADLNGDGKLDFVATFNDVGVLLGNGNGTLGLPPIWTGVYPQYDGPIAVGDFNGDGFPDLAVALFDYSTVAVLLNDGIWQPPPPAPPP